MPIWSKNPSGTAARPPAAVEITPEGVMAAVRRAPGQSPLFAWQPLPPGTVLPGQPEPNLPAVAEAIRSALSAVSCGSHAITLVVPDSAVRVFVLDFDALPPRPSEALPVIRFRLRKMVPFEVEQAGVSYQILAQSPTECRVLAAVIPGPLLHEYESTVQAAGFEPGAVLPSTLAALAGIDALEAVLAVHLDGLSLTTAIATGNDLLLYRTLDLPEDQTRQLYEIRRGIAVALAYYEDHLQARPTQLLFAGNGGAARFARWLDDPELTVAEIASHPATGVLTPLGEASVAGVTGALAEVR